MEKVERLQGMMDERLAGEVLQEMRVMSFGDNRSNVQILGALTAAGIISPPSEIIEQFGIEIPDERNGK